MAIPATAVPPAIRAKFAHRRSATAPRKALAIAGFTLWVSGAKGGGWCEALERTAAPDRWAHVSCGWPAGGDPIHATWSPQLMWGRVQPQSAQRLQLDFKDGRSRRVPMNDGFFLYRIPDAALARGPAQALIAYDKHGARIGRLEVAPAVPPIMTFGGIRRPPGGARVALKRAAIARSSEWGRAVIWTAPSGLAPARCSWLTVGTRVYGGECHRKDAAPRSLWQVVPLRFRDRGQTIAILWGQVGDDVASLRLLFQDGREAELATQNGFYLYPFERSQLVTGHRPAFLVAAAANGRTLKKRLLVEYTAA